MARIHEMFDTERRRKEFENASQKYAVRSDEDPRAELRKYFDDQMARRLWMRVYGTMEGYDAWIDEQMD